MPTRPLTRTASAICARSYLAEANADMGRQYYAGGAGWYGPGWYWDPWFWSYTWLPGNGIFYSPFGWGFYSPWMVGYAPYYGLRGYGYYGRYYAGQNRPAPAAGASEGHGFAAVRGGRSLGLAGPGFRGGSFCRWLPCRWWAPPLNYNRNVDEPIACWCATA